MEDKIVVLNPDHAPFLRSVMNGKNLYPAFVIPINLREVDGVTESVRMGKFQYFPFRAVRPGKPGRQTVLVSFETNPGAVPEMNVVLNLEIPIGMVLTILASMGQHSMQIPFVFIDENKFSATDGDINMSDIVFAAGLPMSSTEELDMFIEQFEDAVKSKIDRPGDDGSPTVTFNLVDLEAISRAFSHTYSISQGDTETLLYLLSQVDFINNAETILDDSEDHDVQEEAAIFTGLPKILFSAYRASLDATGFDESLVPEPDKEFDDIIADADDLEQEMLQVVDVEDMTVPAELRRMKLMKTWDNPLLDSELSVMKGILDTIRKQDDFDKYEEVFALDLAHKETFEHAVDFYGASRVTVAAMIDIAHRAIKYALFCSTNKETTPEQVPMFNLLEWFDLTHRTVSWEWLALVKPLQNYDVELSTDFMMIEQKIFRNVELQPGVIIAPKNMMMMLQTALTSILVLPTWQEYDFTNFAADAMHLGVNIEGFDSFVEWFDEVIDDVKEMFDETEDLQQTMETITSKVVSEGFEDLDKLAKWVSLTLPVLAEIHPPTTKFDVGSEEWAQHRKMFILQHLIRLTGGNLAN